MNEIEVQEELIVCPHDWCNWSSGSAGLERQCRLCGKVQIRSQ